MPPMTLPHMMPTSGTITASLNWMRWMNQTKIQVPRIAAAKAKSARLHKVDDGMNSSASKMPSWAEEMVAPVVGDTNLLHAQLLHDKACHAHSHTGTKDRQQAREDGIPKRSPINADFLTEAPAAAIQSRL